MNFKADEHGKGNVSVKDTSPFHRDSSEKDGDTPLSKEKHHELHGNAPAPPPPPRDVLIGPTLFSVMAFVSLVFTVVSVVLPWYRKQQYMPNGQPSEENLFYLFKHVRKVEGSPDVITHPSSLCTPVGRRVRALEAFSIVSSATTLLMFASSVVNAYKQRIALNSLVRNIMLVFTASAMVSLTIEVCLNFNVYLWSFAACGAGTSYHSQLYEPHIGFGLTVTAWVLTAVGGIIAANKLTFPWDARTVDNCIHAFTMLALVSFLFSVVSCPIPHWFYKDSTTNLVTDVLLWRERVGYFDWNITAPSNRTSLYVKDFQCPVLVKLFYAAEAFSVAAVFFNMAAGVMGLLLWKSLAGSRLPALILSYIGVVVTLVQVVLELIIYYGTWCDGAFAFHTRFFVLTAGFGLATTALSLMVIACIAITVVYYLTEKYFPALIPRKSAKQIAVEECQ